MNVDDLNVIKLDQDLLEKTRLLWIEQAANLDDMPSFDYEKEIDWALKNINYEAPAYGDSIAYGISDGQGVLALLELVHNKRVNHDDQLKMLTIKFSPNYAPAAIEGNGTKLQEMVDIYATAIVGTVALTTVHKAKAIRLYGRDNTLMGMLVALQQKLSEGLVKRNFSAKLEGRWLVIKTH